MLSVAVACQSHYEADVGFLSYYAFFTAAVFAHVLIPLSLEEEWKVRPSYRIISDAKAA